MKQSNIIILGSGLAALSCAARLTELGVDGISLFAPAYGGTPYIAAINFVLPENPYGDNCETYCADMMHAGYQLGDVKLVENMTNRSYECYQLLKRWGVQFAHQPDGSVKLRHVSGHTHPRSLCCTTRLIGDVMIDEISSRLLEKNVTFHMGWRAVRLLTDGARIFGVTVVDENGHAENVYANTVVAAWGGVGHLFGTSTYPQDIRGDTLGIAHRAGADLIDIEFIEFEPFVVMHPPRAVGEPCPTAMLGEGGHLLNAKGERFLLAVRPEGEQGAPKSLINREIWKQVKAGNGNPHGGAYLDLRHIPREVLQGYPWFYERLMKSGLDPCKELIEIGPMPHSCSGGIHIDAGYQSNISGLYAVGEACGGVHGACRCAGNAASQAAISGMLCAESISNHPRQTPSSRDFPVSYNEDKTIYHRYVLAAREAAAGAVSAFRTGEKMQAAKAAVEELLSREELKRDTDATNTLCAMELVLEAALSRKESRGVHLRQDYPDMSEAFQHGILIKGEKENDC